MLIHLMIRALSARETSDEAVHAYGHAVSIQSSRTIIERTYPSVATRITNAILRSTQFGAERTKIENIGIPLLMAMVCLSSNQCFRALFFGSSSSRHATAHLYYRRCRSCDRKDCRKLGQYEREEGARIRPCNGVK